MINRYFLFRISQIKLYRWIICIAFLFLVLVYDVVQNKNVPLTNFVELFIYHSSSIYFIGFYMLVAVIIIFGDIGNNMDNAYEHQVFIRCLPRSKYLTLNICCYALEFLLLTLVAIIIICVSIFMIYGSIGLSNGAVLALLGQPHIPTIQGILFLVLFLWLRLMFLGLGMAIINIKTGTITGFLFGIAITLIDFWFYEIFDILYPLNILPMEHTRILFTEAVAPVFTNTSRGSLLLSTLYWIVLISIEFVLYKKIIYKKDFLK